MKKIRSIVERNYKHNRVSQRMSHRKYFYKDPTWKIVQAALLHVSYTSVDVADVIRDVDLRSWWWTISMTKLKKLLEMYGLSCCELNNLGVLYIKDKPFTFILRYRSNDGMQYCFGRKSADTSIISFTFTSCQKQRHMVFSEFWERFVRGKKVRMLIISAEKIT